ncbi:unnamed protein product [Timema podura]|uniref:Venom peptide n=1 Tax=Timema podura TaxID=61482 RepID=A0ABN7NFK7_TIMPD|nr:unnamed protein product [Timema podura]
MKVQAVLMVVVTLVGSTCSAPLLFWGQNNEEPQEQKPPQRKSTLGMFHDVGNIVARSTGKVIGEMAGSSLGVGARIIQHFAMG